MEHAVLARVEGQIARRRQHPAGIAVLGFLIPPDFPARFHVPGFVHLVPPDELPVRTESPDVADYLDVLVEILHPDVCGRQVHVAGQGIVRGRIHVHTAQHARPHVDLRASLDGQVELADGPSAHVVPLGPVDLVSERHCL